MKYTIDINGLKRDLPICKVNDTLYIGAFVIFGDVELTEHCAKELLKVAPEFDYIITPEAKAIPLAYEMSKQCGKEYIVARKGVKAYMEDAFSVTVHSITTLNAQTLVLDAKEAEKIMKSIQRSYLRKMDKKRKRIKERIDKAFEHFTEKTKYSLSEARKDLRDSLRFIAGNYRLTKSKSGVKAGIYYSNDLMTNPCDLRDLTYYLKRKEVVVYEEVMKGAPEREKYIECIKKMRDSFDFPKQWEAHKSYTLKDKRIREISQWL